jgi:hypothetical protein
MKTPRKTGAFFVAVVPENGSYSSPCTVGMSWVGAICGTGFAGTEPVVTGAAACTSAGFGAGAAACWIGAGTGLAASGFAFGTGTVRLAT